MDVISVLGSALGLGFLAGIRLYATVLAVGLAIRFGLLHVRAGMAGLETLADWRVLALATVGFLAEFFADKIPWVDSAWDAVHTFVRPIGAALIAATALGDMDPKTRVFAVLLTAGAALTSHSGKAATRAIVNHSPEPVSNVALSLAEDAFVPVGVWVATAHPIVALCAVVVLAIATFAFLRLAYGALRRSFGALAKLAGS